MKWLMIIKKCRVAVEGIVPMPELKNFIKLKLVSVYYWHHILISKKIVSKEFKVLLLRRKDFEHNKLIRLIKRLYVFMCVLVCIIL